MKRLREFTFLYIFLHICRYFNCDVISAVKQQM